MAIKYEELWKRWRESGEMAARDQLAETYLWLVRYVAGRLTAGLPPQFDPADVEAYGCFGLLEAIRKYDPARGIRFETLAIPWIRGSCLEGIRALQWAPALRKRVRQLEKAQAELEGKLGRFPTDQELAVFLGVDLDELQSRVAEVGCLSILSLEQSVVGEEGEGLELAERLADPDAVDPQKGAEAAERRDRVMEALESLSEQERLVVTLFYYEGLTGREISAVTGLSAARISQVHSRAILRLRGKLARAKAVLVS